MDPDGLKIKIRKTEDFEEDWFGWPEEQAFPHDHYEFKSWGTVGAIASGKSTVSKDYCANRLNERWEEGNVDFFEAHDLWGIVEGIKNSTKQVHYVIIDDASPIFNSRRSNSDNNVDLTDFYFEIRHQLEDAAIAANGNKGGLVFFNVIVQNKMAIDNRLREALGFIVFKTYDKNLDKEKVNFEIKRVLKKITYQTIVCCRYFYRQLAVVVDCEDKYTLIFSEKAVIPVKYEKVFGENLYKKQFNRLIDFLLNNVNLNKKSWYIKGRLLLELNEMRKSERFVRIDKADFDDIIIIAKTLKEDTESENEENITKERVKELEEEIEKERNYSQMFYLRDTNHFSFKRCAVAQGISESQFFKRYTKAAEVQKRRLSERISEHKIKDGREFALNLLIVRVGINKILQAERSDLQEYIRVYVPSTLHQGEVDALANYVYELIQEKYIKGIGKQIFQEFVAQPVKEMLEKNISNLNKT